VKRDFGDFTDAIQGDVGAPGALFYGEGVVGRLQLDEGALSDGV
jgi:hypothetical protein